MLDNTSIDPFSVMYDVKCTVYHVTHSFFNSCHSVGEGSEDNSTIIMVTGGVLGASIILVLIVILTVGAVFIVLHHKHKEALNQGMPSYADDYCT